jgi:CRISPR-associated protein Cas2
MDLSGYRTMWLITMFDLPVDTEKAKKQYTHFRKFLLGDGFCKMQFSVYVRYCASIENTEVHSARVGQAVPPDGEVRVFTLTDKQYEQMQVFRGKRRVPTEEPPAQLEFF